MSWHNDRSGRQPSHFCSASAARSLLAALFARLRPLAPVIAVLGPEPRVFDDACSSLSALSAVAAPGRGSARHSCSRARSTTPSWPPDRPARGLDPRPPRRARNGSTGERLPRRPRRAGARGCSRFLVFGLDRPDRGQRADGPPVLPPGRQRRRSSRRSRPRTAPSSGRSLAARPDLRPQRAPAGHERPDVRRQDPAGGPADDRVARGRRPARRAARHRSGRHQHRDRQQPGLGVRPRPDRRATSTRTPPASSPRPATDLPGVEVVVEARRANTPTGR